MVEFRKGDVVSFEGVVDFVSAGRVYIKPGHDRGGLFDALPGDLKLLHRLFVTGERVRYTPADIVGDIIGTHGEWLWLDTGDGYTQAVPAAECKPEPPAAVGETIVNGLRVTPRLYGQVPEPTYVPGLTSVVLDYTTAAGDTLEAVAYVFDTSVDTVRIENESVQSFGNSEELPAGLVLKVNDNRIPF